MDSELYNCRFYEKQFPEVNDLVVVRVLDIDTTGAKVELLEDNNIEGLIITNELSRVNFFIN